MINSFPVSKSLILNVPDCDKPAVSSLADADAAVPSPPSFDARPIDPLSLHCRLNGVPVSSLGEVNGE
jgi:hypothetical protein